MKVLVFFYICCNSLTYIFNNIVSGKTVKFPPVIRMLNLDETQQIRYI